MAILGTLLKKGIMLRESREQQDTSPIDLQKRELHKLLLYTQFTQFAKAYRFTEILKSFERSDRRRFYDSFKENVPIFDYDKIHDEWWRRARSGEKDVCRPGKIKYFALSSGTSGVTSKYIPVTGEMMKSIRRTSMRQMLTLSKYDLSPSFYSKGILMLGGSTDLRKSGHYFEGDLSGITTSQIPFWFQHFYKPGKKIAKTNDWNEKLGEIVRKAKYWDIGIIAGVPAWIQILIEKILHHYRATTIHDIWPNLKVFVHGGVSFEPYKKGFERLLEYPLLYMETYLASEGFFAFQSTPNRRSMKLVLNNGIFYEFVPFDEHNFDDEGLLKDNPVTLKVDEVEEGKEYALLITTNAGAWRYLIGDVIEFVSVEESEIIITGRTTHFMSLCGEHLSLDNMNKAIEGVENELDIDIREFTLLGEPCGSLFAHHWYIGTDDEVNEHLLGDLLDKKIQELNDDYKVERTAALKEVRLNVLPPSFFYQWMEDRGSLGSQNKFPRVLKKEKASDWKSFLDRFPVIERKFV